MSQAGAVLLWMSPLGTFWLQDPSQGHWTPLNSVTQPRSSSYFSPASTSPLASLASHLHQTYLGTHAYASPPVPRLFPPPVPSTFVHLLSFSRP